MRSAHGRSPIWRRSCRWMTSRRCWAVCPVGAGRRTAPSPPALGPDCAACTLAHSCLCPAVHAAAWHSFEQYATLLHPAHSRSGWRRGDESFARDTALQPDRPHTRNASAGRGVMPRSHKFMSRCFGTESRGASVLVSALFVACASVFCSRNVGSSGPPKGFIAGVCESTHSRACATSGGRGDKPTANDGARRACAHAVRPPC